MKKLDALLTRVHFCETTSAKELYKCIDENLALLDESLIYHYASSAYYGSATSTLYSMVDKYFPDIQESEYEVRSAAAFDEWDYYVYYDFTDKDVCDAWLAEMDNADHHWTYLLYGVYDRKDIGKEDAEPGYYQDNWGSPASVCGKTIARKRRHFVI
jgi:hypothetical protein